MESKEFVKRFSKITMSGICKKLNIERTNVISGKTRKEKYDKVKEEIENQIAQLYIKKE